MQTQDGRWGPHVNKYDSQDTVVNPLSNMFSMDRNWFLKPIEIVLSQFSVDPVDVG